MSTAKPSYIDPPHVIYADDALVVLHKPAGLLCVPGRGPDKQDCLSARVQNHYADALIVHRLDMATSGLVLMARGKDNQRLLSMAFENRQVHKLYVAHVAGNVSEDQGEINLPLITDWPNRPKQKVDHVQGKPSLTRWKVTARSADSSTTKLELEPYTGRSHQLRLHLAAIGHPILGDALYASPELVSPYPRLMLHAWQLSFTHPVTGQRVEFETGAAF